jgi:hypothetical protein
LGPLQPHPVGRLGPLQHKKLNENERKG